MYTVIGIRKEESSEVFDNRELRSILVSISFGDTKKEAIQSALTYLSEGISRGWDNYYGPYSMLALVGNGIMRELKLAIPQPTLTVTENNMIPLER